MPVSVSSRADEAEVHLLLLFGGLRGPSKPMARMFAPCPCPLPMRACGPPGTGMGPLPFAPAMLPFDGCRKSVEDRWAIRGLGELSGEKGGFAVFSW